MFEDFEDDEFLDMEEGASASFSSAVPDLKPPRANPQVTGHQQQEGLLLAAFNSGKLPHALIFAGPEGIGKSTFAFRLARFLFKHGKKDDDAQDSLFGAPPEPVAATSFDVPETDPVFARVASGGHADLLTVERPIDERKGTRKGIVDVDSVRKIAPFLRMTASEGGWRVVIVDDAETMNRNAQNAILKILEEPPAQTLLILICHRLGAMIPTIRSRCRTIHFQPLGRPVILDILKRGAAGLSPGEDALLADLAEGSAGRALTIHEEGGYSAVNTLVGHLENFPDWEWPLIHQMAENMGRFGADDAAYRNFSGMFLWICEQFLRAKAAGAAKLPEILQRDRLIALLNHYSLEQWIGICEKLQDHFTAVDRSNLDKRQGVLGAFALFDK